MVELQPNTQQEFRNDLLPDITVFVDDAFAILNFPEETEYTQDQIRELISLLVDTYEYMDTDNIKQKDEII